MGSDLINPAASSSFTMPPGALLQYGGAAAPSGWLLCDGSSYLRADYPDLFAAVGTTFGFADATHFNVPDGRDRLPLGASAARPLGVTGGAIGHSHDAGHGHAFSQPNAHAVTQPNAHAVTQPNAHAVTQPNGHSAHAALATHQHELPFIKVAGGTGALRMLASSIFGTGTSRAPESVSAAPTALVTAAAVELSQAVTGGTPDAHSAHAGTAVDAHAGTAVSAHAGTAVDAHAGGAVTNLVGSTGTADPPYLAVNWIVKT